MPGDELGLRRNRYNFPSKKVVCDVSSLKSQSPKSQASSPKSPHRALTIQLSPNSPCQPSVHYPSRVAVSAPPPSGLKKLTVPGTPTSPPASPSKRLGKVPASDLNFVQSLKTQSVMDGIEGSLEPTPFELALDSLRELHFSDIVELETENEDLRARLDQVLISTWGLSRVGGGMKGVVGDGHSGTLELYIAPTEDRNEFKYKVSKDAQAMEQLEKQFAFTPLDEWPVVADYTETMRQSVVAYSASEFVRSPSRRSLEMHFRSCMEEEEEQGKALGRSTCTIHPGSNKRLCWDITGMVLLVYDIITIPISMYGAVFSSLLEWVTLIFWTFDCVASCVTGYIDGNVAVMTSSLIIKNYLKGWFWLDMIVLCPDWISRIIEYSDAGIGQAPGLDFTGLLRIFRILRVLRLLRLAKLKKMLTRLKDNIDSELVFIVIQFTQLASLILFLNHLVGSFFYMLGDLSSQWGMYSWIDALDLRDEALYYKYITSFQWSLSRFSLADSSVQALSMLEKTWDTLVTLMGSFMFCIFVSSTTDWLRQIYVIKGEFSSQMWLLRRFCRQKQVVEDLRSRLQHYLSSQERDSRAIVQESRLDILEKLTPNLLNELKFQVEFTGVRALPIFMRAEYTKQEAIYSMTRTCAKTVLVSLGEVLLERGQKVQDFYIITKGSFDYSMPTVQSGQMVEANDWVCEACLWVQWAGRGTLTLQEGSGQIITMHAPGIRRRMSQDEDLFALMGAYCEVYVEWLNEITFDDIVDINMCSSELITQAENVSTAERLVKEAVVRVKEMEVAPKQSKQSSTGKNGSGRPHFERP